jgi:hypothetical protein
MKPVWQKYMDDWRLPAPVRGVATHEWYLGDLGPRLAEKPHPFEGYEIGGVVYAWIDQQAGCMATEIRTIHGQITVCGGALMESRDRAQFDSANVFRQVRDKLIRSSSTWAPDADSGVN